MTQVVYDQLAPVVTVGGTVKAPSLATRLTKPFTLVALKMSNRSHMHVETALVLIVYILHNKDAFYKWILTSATAEAAFPVRRRRAFRRARKAPIEAGEGPVRVVAVREGVVRPKAAGARPASAPTDLGVARVGLAGMIPDDLLRAQQVPEPLAYSLLFGLGPALRAGRISKKPLHHHSDAAAGVPEIPFHQQDKSAAGAVTGWPLWVVPVLVARR